MNVLIVQSQLDLGTVWLRHLERHGMRVTLVTTQEQATNFLALHDVDIIILDLVISEGGSALAVSDYANYRQPEARVIFVTDASFFSDGSIFAHSANARAFLPSSTPPEDLAAMVEYYAADVS